MRGMLEGTSTAGLPVEVRSEGDVGEEGGRESTEVLAVAGPATASLADTSGTIDPPPTIFVPPLVPVSYRHFQHIAISVISKDLLRDC